MLDFLERNLLKQWSTLEVLGYTAILLVASPLLVPLLLIAAWCVLAWAFIFSFFKSRYDITISRDVLPPEPDVGRVTTKDGVNIRYLMVKVSGSGSSEEERGPGKVVLCCNPLGQKGFKSWGSLIAAVAQTWGSGTTFICWDYRGFFESDDPKRLRTIDVRNHAEDGAEVLKAAVGDRGADLLVGHSMGVQVGLEFALLYPEKVSSIILLNGTYGHALQTGLQPLVKLPYVGGIICNVILWLLEKGHEEILETVRRCAEPFIGAVFTVISYFFGSKELQKVMGKDYMLSVWNSYLGGVCSNSKSMKAFLRGFQVLDAHSTGHLMYQLGHPTLLIAGIWDVFTPAYNMSVMKRQMGNARLVIDAFSSHFTCLEHPELLMAETARFLSQDVKAFKRLNTFDFKKVS